MLRVIAQRVDAASLLVDNVDKWVTIRSGVVLYVSFLQGATMETVDLAVTSLTTAKIFAFDAPAEGESRAPVVSIADRRCDVLIVPQATLAGKLKAKGVQYHGQCPKEDALTLYTALCVKLSEALLAGGGAVLHGTYGNRQGLKFDSPGPMTHCFEF